MIPWRCSLRLTCLVVAAFALGGPGTGAAAAQTPAKPSYGAFLGWYEMSPGRFSLVTPSPSRGLLLLDFESWHFARLAPAEDSAFLWGPAGEKQREVRFVPGKDGKATELRWRERGGAEGVARRSDSYGYSQEEVTFKSGGIELAGLVLSPRTKGRHPGAVLVHGSGAGSRDNIGTFVIANHLALQGVAVLLPDKRGAGKSGGDWKGADFWDLSNDALAAVRVLQGRAGVDARRVGLVGLSQGGWIAPLAAARSRQVAYVVNVSGPAVPVKEQMRHETVQDLKRAGAPEAAIEDVLGLFRLLERYLRGEAPWEEYEAALKEKRSGAGAALFREFPGSPDDWQLAFYHRIGGFDPVPFWRRLDIPALIVYGELDETQKTPVRESVRRLREAFQGKDPGRWTIRVFESTGHGFGDAKTKQIRKDFLDFVAGWVKEHAGPRT
jgi:pimeloyl-ACP methyl ester carboxylesterase